MEQLHVGRHQFQERLPSPLPLRLGHQTKVPLHKRVDVPVVHPSLAHHKRPRKLGGHGGDAPYHQLLDVASSVGHHSLFSTTAQELQIAVWGNQRVIKLKGLGDTCCMAKLQ